MRAGVRKTEALQTRDEKEAARKALELLDSPELGIAFEWETEIENYIALKTARNEFSRFTGPQRKTVLLKFSNWAKSQRIGIGKTTTEHIQKFYESQRKKLKETTLHGYVTGGLGPFFRWLEEERKVISKNPVKGVKLARLDLIGLANWLQVES